MDRTPFNIAAVERDTGLSKDLLRMWERRYGFPAPTRDANGERLYPPEQVARLRLLKRLIDQGHRPGKLLALDRESLSALAGKMTAPAPRQEEERILDNLDELLAMVRANDAPGLSRALARSIGRQGLRHFVLDTMAPLTTRVGEAWESGAVQVFQEHMFTEICSRVLRQSTAGVPPGRGRPVVMLATVGGEQHTLGLHMVETLFSLEDATCLHFGAGLPLTEIPPAAAAHGADIVALSFSAAFPVRQVPAILGQLRDLLPAPVALWAGGAGVRRIPAEPGITLMGTLEEGLSALAEWRRVADE